MLLKDPGTKQAKDSIGRAVADHRRIDTMDSRAMAQERSFADSQRRAMSEQLKEKEVSVVPPLRRKHITRKYMHTIFTNS